MMHSGRILIVEAEVELRLTLDRELEAAGHDVATVAEEAQATRLIEEGLEPDVVLAEVSLPPVEARLREIAPRAIHLRIDRALAPDSPLELRGEAPERCSAEPAGVLRAVEELLLGRESVTHATDDARCLDLARRLSSSLPRAQSPEERIDLLCEGFDAFFGVHGSLVVRRSLGGPKGWIEANHGLTAEVSARISEEIARRSSHRSVRPFLTSVSTASETHWVACLAVEFGGSEETELALVLERAPSAAGLRDTLMNLLGSAMRSSTNAAALREEGWRLDTERSRFESLLRLTRELSSFDTAELLSERVLGALRVEFGIKRSAMFLRKSGGRGLLSLVASSGIDDSRLARIGLSSFHGIGGECLEFPAVRKVSAVPLGGVAAREERMLAAAGLQWAAPLREGSRLLGVFFFGDTENVCELAWHRPILEAFLGSVSAALESLERAARIRSGFLGGVKGLVAALELRVPEDRGHAERVAWSASRLGEALGLSAEELRELTLAAFLHDVGKVGLASDRARDTSQFMRHTLLGSKILARANLAPSVIQGVEQHHERFDGHGHPYGLRREEIHLFGRIVAVANAHDRLRYGADSIGAQESLRRLALSAGLLYDPGLVAAFADAIEGGAKALSSADKDWLDKVVGAL